VSEVFAYFLVTEYKRGSGGEALMRRKQEGLGAEPPALGDF